MATYVLKLERVQRSIQDLRGRRIHPFFPAYLHLRSRAKTLARTTALDAEWRQLAPFLEVPGGPPGKPYFRPFWEGDSDLPKYWLNSNLAGSYAASSLRSGQPPMLVVAANGSNFDLREGHAQLALEHLLSRQPIPITPLATFLLRDFGFESVTPPEKTDLIEVFNETFAFDSLAGGDDFRLLFAGSENEPGSEEMFELLPGSNPAIDESGVPN